MSKERYEAKKEARIERLENAAEKAHERSEAAYERSRSLTSGIPFGQPILIGHHSEKRHRNAIEKSHAAMGRSVTEAKKAEHYEARAAAARENTAISSDDPEAVRLLKEKLEGLEAKQAMMKKVNAAYRKFKKNPASLEKADLSEEAKKIIREFVPPYSYVKAPFESWALSNNNANIKRVKGRIAELEAAAENEYVEKDHGFVRYVEDPEENRVQLFFDGKPSAEIRGIVKRNGFRWSRFNMAWQRHLNNAGRYAAESAIKAIEALES